MPAVTKTVDPAAAESQPFWIVLKGAACVPGLVSLPVAETKKSAQKASLKMRRAERSVRRKEGIEILCCIYSRGHLTPHPAGGYARRPSPGGRGEIIQSPAGRGRIRRRGRGRIGRR